MTDGFLHVFELKGGVLYLDGRKVKGLTSYEVKKESALDLTELTLNLTVDELKVESPREVHDEPRDITQLLADRERVVERLQNQSLGIR